MIDYESIKNTLKSPGWANIELMIEEEMNDLKDVTDMATNHKTAQELGIEVIARQQGVKMIKKLFDKIRKLKNYQEVKQVSYK
jgi:hypothetical protein